MGPTRYPPGRGDSSPAKKRAARKRTAQCGQMAYWEESVPSKMVKHRA